MQLTNYALRESDIPLLSQVQEKLLAQQVIIPDWRETDPGVQRRFQILTFEFAFVDHRITPFAQPPRGDRRVD